MVPWFSDDQIRDAKSIDLYSYLSKNHPSELIQVTGKVFCTAQHDSLQISNGKWYWFSQGVGGVSAIDYLIKVEGLSFMKAVEEVLGKAPNQLPSSVPPTRRRKLILPEKNNSSEKVKRYLNKRGIHPALVSYCLEKGLLYEAKEFPNAVFIGMDKENAPRYAAIRSTVCAFKSEASGSDKHWSFKLIDASNNSHLHIFESAIDLLSYATLMFQNGQDWRREALLSLAGVFVYKRESVLPVALEQFFVDYPKEWKIHLHLDNDEPGRAAAQSIMNALKGKYNGWNQPPPFGKDVNEYLLKQTKEEKENGNARKQCNQ